MASRENETRPIERSTPLRTVFCGTPEFAVPTLRAMIGSEFRPSLVVTQPDRPRGRGQRLALSPVKEVAVEASIPVCQPENFNAEETLERIRETGAEVAVVVAYSAKIGNRALSLLPEGWLNLHPSLLPAYRGAAPLQWALIHGETRTGLTTFFLNREWDAGPICLQREIEIGPGEDYGALAKRCAEMGADLALESLRAIQKGSAEKRPQDDRLATFAPLLKPEDSVLDWNLSALQIHNRVRGFSPRPGAFAEFRGKRIKILRTSLMERGDSNNVPGRVADAGPEGLVVEAASGGLLIELLQPENRSAVSGVDFVNGYRVKVGDRFG